MYRAASLALLTTVSIAILTASFGIGGAVLFAVAAGVFPVALIVIGAVPTTIARDGRGALGTLLSTVIVLAVILEGTIIALLALRGTVTDGERLFGVPLPTAVLLLGLFVLPLIVVGLGYAWSFDRLTLRDGELEALRRRFERSDLDPPRV